MSQVRKNLVEDQQTDTEKLGRKSDLAEYIKYGNLDGMLEHWKTCVDDKGDVIKDLSDIEDGKGALQLAVLFQQIHVKNFYLETAKVCLHII